MRQLLSIVAVAGLSVAALAAAPQGVNLASIKGWRIVLPPDAIPSEKYAAEELQGLLEKATGHKLAVATKAERSDGNIFVAASPALAASAVAIAVDGFGPEDFRIVIRDGNIAIAGGRPRGTLYGVYVFAEDYLGVRFLTADHTHVPAVGAWRVVGPVDRYYHPPLGFRWSYYGETNTNPVFATRLRCNTVQEEPRLGGKTGMGLINHSLGVQIPSTKFAKEHPEYYALHNGKRHGSVTDNWAAQPCLTHPGVLRIVTDAVLADLAAHPNRENISVSQNDNDTYCRCPNCADIDAREGTPMGSLLTFVNAVAAEVAKKHPRVLVGTLSYWYSRKPPRTLRPLPNVQIQLCSIECCQLHAIDDPSCPKNREFCDDMLNWGKICSNVSVWNYNTNFQNYLLPFPNLRIIEPNVRYFVAHEADGVFMQAAGNALGAELSDLRNYVISGLLWDPSRSGAQLADEFLRLHYRRAAPPISEFINRVHDHALAGVKHPNCFGDAGAYSIDKHIAAAGLEAFAKALDLADDDTVRARVEKASICAYRAAIEPVWRTKDGAKLEPALAERLRPQARRMLELCKKHGVTRFSEHMDIKEAASRLKALFGVSDSQAW